jgi:sodium-dependent phosphate cotransporter
VTALLAALTGTVSALVAGFSHLLFNIFGILIIYGIPPLRRIPLAFAENIADVAVSKKYVPILYLLTIFVIIPFCIIYFGR